MNLHFDFLQFLSAFVVLFAIIDIVGSLPIIMNLRQKRGSIHPELVVLYSLAILIGFLFAGDFVLKLFGVDIHSFAIAGGLVIFILALEMILGVEIFKNDEPKSTSTATLVPLVFPLIAGAGSFTALLSLRAEYAIENIILALVANMVVVYIVLKFVKVIEKLLGNGGVYLMRKFFGIILLAISVKLFISNTLLIISGQ